MNPISIGTIEMRLKDAPIIPLIHGVDPVDAVKITKALIAGGISVIEVVLRSKQAMHCLKAIADEVPEALVGAGTVLTVTQAREVIEAGATFVVSPGLDDKLVEYVHAADRPMIAGIATATELQKANNLGLRTVKFFPASHAGGVGMLNAFSAVFPEMRFIPTGGIGADNLADYLHLPSVIACGGSWLTPLLTVQAGDYETVTQLAREAVATGLAVMSKA